MDVEVTLSSFVPYGGTTSHVVKLAVLRPASEEELVDVARQVVYTRFGREGIPLLVQSISGVVLEPARVLATTYHYTPRVAS